MEDREERIKQYAMAKAGQRVGFVEGNEIGGDVKTGRVVGYYLGMCQVIVEVDFHPRFGISIPSAHVTLLVAHDSGKNHCMVGWDELRGGPLPKDKEHPHTCDRCGSPSLNLFRFIECTNPVCPCYKKP